MGFPFWLVVTVSEWGPNLTHTALTSGVCYFGCSKGVPKSVQVLLNGTETVMVLTLRYHIASSIYYLLYTIYHMLSTHVYIR